jgi:hypothetical protein
MEVLKVQPCGKQWTVHYKESNIEKVRNANKSGAVD